MQILLTLIRRCELEPCSVVLYREKDRFCCDEHRVEWHNRQRYREEQN